jgi:hypothetical protein
VTVAIATTLTTFAMVDPERSFLWDAWLRNAEQIRASVEEPVRYFVAIQIDSRGIEPFRPLVDRLAELDGAYWTYSLDDGRSTVTQANRLRHITFGQNLCSEFATSIGASHFLHMAADCEPPADVLPRLLEVGLPLVAAACSTYCMSGPRVESAYPLEGPPLTAVCMLIARKLFKRIKWRYDPDLNLADDPSYTYDAEMYGVTAVTRTDVVALHHPAAISRIEDRFPGLDMSVQP